MISRRLRALALICAAALGGCSSLDNCPDSQPTRTVETGTTFTDARLYESAPWNGPLDAFPAKSALCFAHGLGATPEWVNTWVSFSENGTEASGSVSENAGNQGLTTCVDDEVIVLRNDTCERGFYVRVAAIATGETSGSPACDCSD